MEKRPVIHILYILLIYASGLDVSWADESFIVVSDIDDTIKVSEVNHPLRAFWRGVFGNDVFCGMSVLYEGLSQNDQPTVFISGSPVVLWKKLSRILEEQRFPPRHRIFLKKVGRYSSLEEYKLSVLNKLAHNYPFPFLLIGDNTQKDAKIYMGFQKQWPERVTDIYIREVSEKPIPEAVNGFSTAFDIALNEVRRGRLSIAQAQKVGYAVLDGLFRTPQNVIPSFARCPDNRFMRHAYIPRELVGLDDRIEERLNSYCLHR